MRITAIISSVSWHDLGAVRLLVAVGIALGAVSETGPAAAQSTSSLYQQLSPEQLQRLSQRSKGGAVNSQPLNTQPLNMEQKVIQPAPLPTTPPPTSRLERVMSTRAGVQLQQFGYDRLGIGQPVAAPQAGSVQDTYILGPGDEVDVTLRGQENAEYRASVDTNGQVVLPKLSPISAAGRTLGAFRQDLLAAIHRAYVSTEGYVSVGQIRQVSVLVTGEVANPGTRVLTGLSTPVDAILLSGGIKRSGSLRKVKLVRNGQIRTLDLYSIITQHGIAQNISLANGDRIVVPPLGPTVAVTGWVRRPGIYELRPGSSAISVRGLLSLAGGLEVRGKYRLSILRVSNTGRSVMRRTSRSGRVTDSDILYAQPAAEETTGKATLSGGSVLAGRYAISKGTMLSDIVKSPGALGDSPYTLFSIVSRKDPKTYLRTLIAFASVAVLNGKSDMRLQSDDIVRVFSTDEAQMLRAVIKRFRAHQVSVSEAARNPEANVGQTFDFNGTNGAFADKSIAADAALGASGTVASAEAGSEAVVQQLANQSLTPKIAGSATDVGKAQNLQAETPDQGSVATNKEVATFGEIAGQLDVPPLVLANFMLDHLVQLDGAVRGPGTYPVGPDTSLADVVEAAGGTSNWADQSGVELTTTGVNEATGKAVTRRVTLPLGRGMLASYIVQPSDQFRFRQVFTSVDVGSVTLQGQIRFPGQYQITRGERLSDLLVRGGGLTSVAYPYGTIFLRRSTAALERTGNQRAANEIENQLMLAMTRRSSTEKLSPDAFSAMQGFVKELRDTKPLGRISVIADPSLLLVRPSSDILLEPNDVVYIPQRPSTVAVLGQVLQPGSFAFRPGTSVEIRAVCRRIADLHRLAGWYGASLRIVMVEFRRAKHPAGQCSRRSARS